ncbi:hypothetical protein P9112_012747 [Eukaryota sp. TZLM1-RC]
MSLRKPSRSIPSPRVHQVREVFTPQSTSSVSSKLSAPYRPTPTPPHPKETLRPSSEQSIQDTLYNLFSLIGSIPKGSGPYIPVLLRAITKVMVKHGHSAPYIPQIPPKPLGMSRQTYLDILEQNGLYTE